MEKKQTDVQVIAANLTAAAHVHMLSMQLRGERVTLDEAIEAVSATYRHLLANPHLPWFGFTQLFEAHVRSRQGWDFTGATTYGSPVMILGHNQHLGWTLTTNEPDKFPVSSDFRKRSG